MLMTKFKFIPNKLFNINYQSFYLFLFNLIVNE